MTLVLVALPDESQGLIEKAGYKVVYTGMGHIAATQKCVESIHKYQPEKIINLGTAGSFEIPVGSLVECTQFVRRDETLPQLDQFIKSNRQTSLVPVTCGSADFITHKKDLTKKYDIMDMEAYALAYVCQNYKIPFLSVKYITDSSDVNFRIDWKKNLNRAAQALSTFLIQTKV